MKNQYCIWDRRSNSPICYWKEEGEYYITGDGYRYGCTSNTGEIFKMDSLERAVYILHSDALPFIGYDLNNPHRRWQMFHDNMNEYYCIAKRKLSLSGDEWEPVEYDLEAMVYDSSCHMYTEYHGGFTLAEYNIQELSNTMNVCYRRWCGWSEQLCSPKYRYYCDKYGRFYTIDHKGEVSDYHTDGGEIIKIHDNKITVKLDGIDNKYQLYYSPHKMRSETNNIYDGSFTTKG